MRKFAELNDDEIMGWWDIARPGEWNAALRGKPGKVEITSDDLEEMAAAYDPALQEAPVTVDHQSSGPAHGWVESLRVAGGVLQARLKDISADLRNWLRQGAYRSRSIEMYKPFGPTGKAYLGALSFLGAAPPAVKGLSPEPALFSGSSAPDCAVVIDAGQMKLRPTPNKEKDDMEEKTTVETLVHSLKEMFSGRVQADQPDGDGRAALLESELARARSALAEMEKSLAALREQRDKLAARLAESEKQAELESFRQELDQAAAQALLTPAEASGYLKLGERLDADSRRMILEEIGSRAPLPLFRELSAPGEKNTAEKVADQRARFVGFPEDPEHDAALELMAADAKLTFSQALTRVRLATRENH